MEDRVLDSDSGAGSSNLESAVVVVIASVVLGAESDTEVTLTLFLDLASELVNEGGGHDCNELEDGAGPVDS